MLLGMDNLGTLGYRLIRELEAFDAMELPYDLETTQHEIKKWLQMDDGIKGPARCATHRIKFKPGTEPIKT